MNTLKTITVATVGLSFLTACSNDIATAKMNELQRTGKTSFSVNEIGQMIAGPSKSTPNATTTTRIARSTPATQRTSGGSYTTATGTPTPQPVVHSGQPLQKISTEKKPKIATGASSSDKVEINLMDCLPGSTNQPGCQKTN